ncbi:MAG TPA: HlyD family efflux transporter periplasmic adaptor subunit [Planctomycetota bacterium]
MVDWTPSRRRPGLVRRGFAALRRTTSGVVWLAAIAALVWLAGVSPSAAGMTGIVDAAQSSVTAPVSGRVAAILVALHQEVEQGQVIARLDDSDVRLRLTQATYELERLRADLVREAADREQQSVAVVAEHGLDAGVEQRRLVSAVEAAQLAALSTRTQLEEARVRVQGAAVEAERLEPLVQQGMVAEPDLVHMRTERDALQKRISELETLHREHLAHIELATQRLREFKPAGPAVLSVDTALEPMRWRLKQQQAALERIAEDTKLLTLQAPIRGRIARISVEAGEWAAAGRSLVAIVDATPRRILAYVPDAVRGQIGASAKVRVTRADASELGTAAVETISPSVVRVPERLWRDPRQEEWAYELVVAATGMERPGERVQLSLLR